LRYKILK